MPLSPRLSRLERTAKARAAKSPARLDEDLQPYIDAIMGDADAHGLMGAVLKLVPDAYHSTSFDFDKAVAERPGLREATAAVSARVDAIMAQR